MNSKSSGSATIKFHPNDFAKFGNVSFLAAEKSGFMLKQGAVNTYSLKKRYFVLYASLYVLIAYLHYMPMQMPTQM